MDVRACNKTYFTMTLEIAADVAQR